ncbi:cytochrome P450 4C1-like isoform X3 [Spodoptera frugiperda]|uniref:Cytochrome P450 4C1-like isoform X3 n=2 Tax=Spodoptera frugiperda TaxID=7108 RepID=A0A9R0DVS2_SPOFR|nr:cytochrome P450 4C1-like isoform X3 [Spodoptera frugiperda]
MYLLVLLVVLGVVYAYCWWKPRSPPTYPGQLPIIGHSHILFKHRNDIWGYLESVGDYVLEHGGIFQFRVGPHIMYVVDDPESVGIIANTCLDKPYFYNFMDDLLGNGLITLNGEMWKIHHKLLNPAFSQHVLNTYLNEMDAQAQNLVSQLTTVAKKGPVNITEFLGQFVLRTVCRTSLRLEVKDQDMIDNEYAKAIEEIEAIIIRRVLNPILHFPFLFKLTAMYKRQIKLSHNNKKLMDPIIHKRKSDLIATKRTVNDNDDSVPGKFKPALDLLLHLSDEQYVLSDDDIRAHLNTFVAASYDTTSAALQTILLVLGSYPEIQERIYNEIQDVLKNRDRLTKHDITKLVYLDAVIKEVLRMYNIVPLIARKIDTDIVLPKYTLRAGSSCIMSIYGLHRHSSWGPDAKQFKPERWLNPATLPTNPNVYAAFGIGKRMCIGKQYSMMSMKTSLVHILRKFRVSADISTLKWKYAVTLRAKAPLIDLTLRSQIN